MPVKPVAIGIAVIALALAVWLIIGGVRRRWLSLLRVPPILGCLALVVILVPTIFGLNEPHPFFNKPAPVASGAVLFFRVTPNPTTNNSILVAVSAQTGKTLWQRSLQGQFTTVTDDGHAVYTTMVLPPKSTTATGVTMLAARGGADGALLWQVSLAGMSVTTAPVLFDGVLYLDAVQFAEQSMPQLLAVRATDGTTLWKVPFGDTTYGSAYSITAAADTVYIQPDNMAFQARRRADGKLLWSQTMDSSGMVAGPTAVYTYSQYGSVTARSAATGAVLWTFGDHDMFHSAVFSGDTLYVSAQHSGNISDANGKLINPETVYALDASTGALRWKFATKSSNSGTLAGGAGSIYIHADDGIHALRAADGTVLWQSDPHTSWTFDGASPVVGTVLYVTAIETLPPDTITFLGPSKGQMYLYAVNTADGSAYWGSPVGPVITIYPHWVL